MFDLVLHVLSQFTTGLLYPLMMLLMSILSASLSRQLNDSVLTPAQTAHSAPPGSGLDGMINFLVFYEALVLWGYTATAGTQDQTEGKIIKYKVCGPLCPITWCFPSLPPSASHPCFPTPCTEQPTRCHAGCLTTSLSLVPTWAAPQFATAGTTWAGGETQTFHTKFKAVVNSTNRKGRLGKRPVFQVPWSYISIEGGPVFHYNLPMELSVLSAFHVKC